MHLGKHAVARSNHLEHSPQYIVTESGRFKCFGECSNPGLSNIWPTILSVVARAEVKVGKPNCNYLSFKGEIDILICKKWLPSII